MSRHYRHRVDANQKGILRTLNKIPGAMAVDIHNGNLTDIILGFRGKNWLFEVKNPEADPCDRRLTPDEKKFHDSWPGQVAVIETVDDALRLIGLT